MSGRPPSTWSATWRVAQKELRSGLRDRQTAIYTVVLPLFLYPALFWCTIQGFLFLEGRREHTAVTVGVAAEAPGLEPAGLSAALEGRARPADPPPDLARVTVVPLGTGVAPGEAGEWMRAGRALRPDALLHLSDPRGAGAEEPARLYYDSTESASNLARERLEPRLDAFAETLREEAATARGRDPRELVPFETDERNVAREVDMGAYVLSFLLPILLVLMSVMGAFFPAVDVTAGERERGTAETTMLLPVPRLAIHQGKIVAVCCSSLIATTLNLLALGLSAGHLLNMLALGSEVRIELPLAALISVAPLALLFSFAVSAVLTGIAALAQSFKEGQALLGPVQLVFIVPAMAAAIPGLDLTPGTALVPVVNVALAFRTMIRGEALPLEYALTALSLLLFAVVSIAVSVRVLSREAVQTGGEGVWPTRVLALIFSPGSSR